MLTTIFQERHAAVTAFFQDQHPSLMAFLHERGIDAVPLGVVLGLVLALPVVSWYVFRGKSTTWRGAPAGSKPMHRLPSRLPLLGDTLGLVMNVNRFHHWLFDICQRYKGEPVLLTAWGRPDLVLMCSVESFDECFRTQFDNFPKGEFLCENLEGVLGNGIFATDGLKWVHQRKTASNLFTARSIRDSMSATVRKHTVTLYRIFDKAAQSGQNIDLFKLFNRLTIEAFSEIGFGIEMNCLEAKEDHPFQTAFDSAQRAAVLRFVHPTWFWKFQRALGIGAEGRLQRDVKMIDDTVLDIIAKSLARRQRGEVKEDDSKDIVSLFLDNYETSPDSQGREFDPKYLRDIVVNFLIAGRDTTAQALSWCFVRLSENPRVVKKIREEIKQLLPGLLDGSIVTPSMEQVGQLTYLEASLRETLRLHPSVPFNTKHVQNDIVLSDGTFIRKGATVGLPSWCLGRMTQVWGPDATEFKPERFIDPSTGKIINFSASKFIAFNAGPRLCLGMNLAMMEMKIVVASLLSRFDIQVLPEQNVTYDFSLTLPVHGELMASVRTFKSM